MIVKLFIDVISRREVTGHQQLAATAITYFARRLNHQQVTSMGLLSERGEHLLASRRHVEPPCIITHTTYCTCAFP